MSDDFVPYDISLHIMDDSESYVIYHALTTFLDQEIQGQPDETMTALSSGALSRAAERLKSAVHGAWASSENCHHLGYKEAMSLTDW